MTDYQKDWYAIVNPHAGSGKTISEWAVAEDTFSELGVQYKAVLTTHKAHATTLSYDAASRGYRRFISVGGDGSFHEVLTGLMNYCEDSGVDPMEFYISVIPIGSGNDWIKTTHVPHDTVKVCRLIASESFGQQDVVKMTTSNGVCYMGNIGGIGFDANVCKRVNSQKEMGKRSKLIYVGGLLYSLFHLKSYKVSVESDGVAAFDGLSYTLALGNGEYCGGGMKQVIDADINDGFIDWMLVPKLPLSKLLSVLVNLLSGKLKNSKCIIYGRCKELKVTLDESGYTVPVEADGELVGNLPATVSITGKKINILVG